MYVLVTDDFNRVLVKLEEESSRESDQDDDDDDYSSDDDEEESTQYINASYIDVSLCTGYSNNVDEFHFKVKYTHKQKTLLRPETLLIMMIQVLN